MKNVAFSVRAKLLNLSRVEGVPLNALMEQYATGQFLYRLAQSEHRERFIVKGAQLFRIWGAENHRPTRDLDLLGYGDPTQEAIQMVFTELTQLETTPLDGIEWGEVTVSSIRDDVSYGGVRAKVNAELAGARLVIQVDVEFGDAITPQPLEKEWHELLAFPSANLLVYPPETVIAEKLEAAVSLGVDNSRMKDLFDLHWLQSHFNFHGEVLTQAVIKTFARRETEIPQNAPLALSAEFSNDEQKQIQWTAFLRKGKLASQSLEDVINGLSVFLLPVIRKEVNHHHWTPSSGWLQPKPSL